MGDDYGNRVPMGTFRPLWRGAIGMAWVRLRWVGNHPGVTPGSSHAWMDAAGNRWSTSSGSARWPWRAEGDPGSVEGRVDYKPGEGDRGDG